MNPKELKERFEKTVKDIEAMRNQANHLIKEADKLEGQALLLQEFINADKK